MGRAMMPKQNDSYGWVKDASSPRKRSLWDRIVRRNDDDDGPGGPGPNAGATLWPALGRPLFVAAS
jgi:hypothetical protein